MRFVVRRVVAVGRAGIRFDIRFDLQPTKMAATAIIIITFFISTSFLLEEYVIHRTLIY